MNAYDIIYSKRNGETLSSGQIRYMVSGFLTGKIPRYQMSAFLMAVFFNGMKLEELYEFTGIMIDSGDTIDLKDIGIKAIDKHSTGGVGDGVSLVLAPLVASMDVAVPMMSGRSLGHTGGTLDKLESIPGFRVDLSNEEFKTQLKDIGVAMIGQTENIAPADKEMYALRDVTATVDSIPLISASIMSKKIAEGADGLVLDVKTGSGAFMQNYEDAKMLAESMISIGKSYGKKMVALITDMGKPLGVSVGNAMEIRQAIELMSGKGPNDMKTIIIELAANMLVLGGIAETAEAGRKMAVENLCNGRAMEKFREIVDRQGGDVDVIKDPDRILGTASNSYEIISTEDGFISGMDTRAIGMCAIEIGAGRCCLEDSIDTTAGIEVLKKTGDRIEKGEKLAVLYSSSNNELRGKAEDYLKSLKFSEEKPVVPQLIHEIIGNCNDI